MCPSLEMISDDPSASFPSQSKAAWERNIERTLPVFHAVPKVAANPPTRNREGEVRSQRNSIRVEKPRHEQVQHLPLGLMFCKDRKTQALTLHFLKPDGKIISRKGGGENLQFSFVPSPWSAEYGGEEEKPGRNKSEAEISTLGSIGQIFTKR